LLTLPLAAKQQRIGCRAPAPDPIERLAALLSSRG
jgi:hypothetical protein